MMDASPWVYEWQDPALLAEPPTVVVCPLKYDKRWAYTIELDDNPVSAFTVTRPMLAEHAWTDAPPGVPGGTRHPFVAGTALIVCWIGGGNSTWLSWEQLRALNDDGWELINHGYWSAGNHWDPSQFLKPDDFRRELFWSQQVLAENLHPGSGVPYFVYPSGDYHYRPYLEEVGIRGASQGQRFTRNILATNADFFSIGRNNLDSKGWSPPEPVMKGFPNPPDYGDCIVDFTHNMGADPASPNVARWRERLETIDKTWGASGSDELWSAPASAVLDYVRAAAKARVEVKPGRLSVFADATLPSAGLTLRVEPISEQATLPTVPGGSVYRQGKRVWITTPPLGGKTLPPVPTPQLERIYQGPATNHLEWSKPRLIAGITFACGGNAPEGYHQSIQLATPAGAQEMVTPAHPVAPGKWGAWNLYWNLPDRPAIAATGLDVNLHKNIRLMEVWAVKQAR